MITVSLYNFTSIIGIFGAIGFYTSDEAGAKNRWWTECILKVMALPTPYMMTRWLLRKKYFLWDCPRGRLLNDPIMVCALALKRWLQATSIFLNMQSKTRYFYKSWHRFSSIEPQSSNTSLQGITTNSEVQNTVFRGWWKPKIEPTKTVKFPIYTSTYNIFTCGPDFLDYAVNLGFVFWNFFGVGLVIFLENFLAWGQLDGHFSGRIYYFR